MTDLQIFRFLIFPLGEEKYFVSFVKFRETGEGAISRDKIAKENRPASPPSPP